MTVTEKTTNVCDLDNLRIYTTEYLEEVRKELFEWVDKVNAEIDKRKKK